MLTVDLWFWPLAASAARLRDAAALLSEDEVARAGRFVKPKDRDHFIEGRARLREILAGYTGDDPRKIVFDYGPQGKPALAAHRDLGFNLSHSNGLAALAFCRGGLPGLDIEATRPIEDAVARRHFSDTEYAALRRLPPGRWRDGFFRCWTRKEAVIKAIGTGLSMPLSDFDVTLAPGEAAALTRIEGDDASAWTLHHLDPAPGWVGALALRNAGQEVRLYRKPG